MVSENEKVSTAKPELHQQKSLVYGIGKVLSIKSKWTVEASSSEVILEESTSGWILGGTSSDRNLEGLSSDWILEE